MIKFKLRLLAHKIRNYFNLRKKMFYRKLPKELKKYVKNDVLVTAEFIEVYQHLMNGGNSSNDNL